jgi:hypothetical protein
VNTVTDRHFEPFELSVLGAEGHLWLSAHSEQGSVYAVPRPTPEWVFTSGHGTPVEWLKEAIGHARREAFDDALRVGEMLRELVFGVPEVATLFQRTRGVAGSRGVQMLIRVLAAPDALAACPWELLLDPQQPNRFLTMARDSHVVRAGRARTYPIRQEMIAPPLNLLLVLSSPLPDGTSADETLFDLYEEKRELLKELRPLVERGLLHLEVEDRPTMERLRSRMGAQRRGFHVLHYLGHAQPTGLKLEHGDQGRSRLVTSTEFCNLLQQLRDLRLALFAGCETARAPSPPAAGLEDLQLSTADQCVRDACPMVIGMQAVLPFGTERLFTRYFYQALTGGRSVADAVRLARQAIAEDDHAGGRLLNWAVPCLFLGGSEPGPLVDPTASATPVPPRRRAGNRLGVRQGELRFISRLNELRLSVDVLSARRETRLLMIVGLPGTGKTAFLDRVIEELDADVAYLLISMTRLLEEDDPLQFLSRRIAQVLSRTGQPVPPQGRDRSNVWWERLLEIMAESPLALAIDDADQLRGDDDDRTTALRNALIELTMRRGRARLALAGTDELLRITSTLEPEQVLFIRLEALSWPDIWQWIRRNLPVLTRYGEENLSAFYADLPTLEDWQVLADSVATRAAFTIGDFPALVRELGSSLAGAPTNAGAPAPPVFGTSPAPEVPPAELPARTLRVAVAGPYTQGRAAEFARGITQYAAAHGVGGRMVGPADNTSQLAELVSLDSPFDANGMSSLASITSWLQDARDADAEVILLDFGGEQPSPIWDDLLHDLAADDRLVVAAAGNDRRPSYPAWCPDALAVGALEHDGRRADYSYYEPAGDKPELFAPKRVAGTPLEVLVADPTHEGTSFAAMHVVAAAIIVWATDLGLSAKDVRSILIGTADDVGDRSDRTCRLNVEAALAETRRQLLVDALERGPLGLQELLAETGMRPELALPILEAAVAEGELRQIGRGGSERYENPEAVYLAYGEVREGPSGPRRTAELTRLVERIRTQARRGRYEGDDVRAMWASDQAGRRMSALAVIEEVPTLGSTDIVIDGISASRSAFEQYHALVAAIAMMDGMTDDDRARLRDAIERQQGPSGHITPGSDRRRLATKVLKVIEGAREPAPGADG